MWVAEGLRLVLKSSISLYVSASTFCAIRNVLFHGGQSTFRNKHRICQKFCCHLWIPTTKRSVEGENVRNRCDFCPIVYVVHDILINFREQTIADVHTAPFQHPTSHPHNEARCHQSRSNFLFLLVSRHDLESIQVEHFMCWVRSFKWRELK